MSYELKRWLRSKRLLVLCAAFVFSGIVTPLITAYSEELIGSLRTSNNVRVLVEPPSWTDAASAYVHNSAQLALLFACYLTAWASSLGPDQRLQHFYRTRATTRFQLFYPRLAMAATVVWIASLLGGCLALYNVLILFEDTDVSKMINAIVIQSLGFVMVSLLAGLVATATNSPAVSALTTYFLLMLVDAFRDASWTHGLLPTSLIRPTDLLKNAAPNHYVGSTAAAVGLVAIVAAVLLSRPLTAPFENLDGKTERLVANSPIGND